MGRMLPPRPFFVRGKTVSLLTPCVSSETSCGSRSQKVPETKVGDLQRRKNNKVNQFIFHSHSLTREDLSTHRKSLVEDERLIIPGSSKIQSLSEKVWFSSKE